jgi:hypothetical protein
VSVLLPTESAPAATLKVAEPVASVFSVLYVPLVSVTDPVGVGLPLPPLTETVTVKACAVVMLDEDGVTTTVGVVFTRVTVTAEDEPVAVL